MARMRWDRETLEAQDPADIDLLMEVLTVERLASAPARAHEYAQVGETNMGKVDIALNPGLLEEYARGR